MLKFRFSHANVQSNRMQFKSFWKDRKFLWFYLKDEADDFNADIESTNNLKSFEYKAKLLVNAAAGGAAFN